MHSSSWIRRFQPTQVVEPVGQAVGGGRRRRLGDLLHVVIGLCRHPRAPVGGVAWRHCTQRPRWGRGSFGTMPTALVRRPGPLLADGLLTHLERVPVDVDLAVRQWQEYVEALDANGWDVVEVAAADDCPDARVRRGRRGRVRRPGRAHSARGRRRVAPRSQARATPSSGSDSRSLRSNRQLGSTVVTSSRWSNPAPRRRMSGSVVAPTRSAVTTSPRSSRHAAGRCGRSRFVRCCISSRR